MRIKFFHKSNGQYVDETMQHQYFVCADGFVYKDNNRAYESQSMCVSLDNFIEKDNSVGWVVVKE